MTKIIRSIIFSDTIYIGGTGQAHLPITKLNHKLLLATSDCSVHTLTNYNIIQECSLLSVNNIKALRNYLNILAIISSQIVSSFTHLIHSCCRQKYWWLTLICFPLLSPGGEPFVGSYKLPSSPYVPQYSLGPRPRGARRHNLHDSVLCTRLAGWPHGRTSAPNRLRNRKALQPFASGTFQNTLISLALFCCNLPMHDENTRSLSTISAPCTPLVRPRTIRRT